MESRKRARAWLLLFTSLLGWSQAIGLDAAAQTVVETLQFDVAGTVVGPDGKPVGAVTVTVVNGDAQAPEKIVKTTADDDGRFVLREVKFQRTRPATASPQLWVEGNGWLGWKTIPLYLREDNIRVNVDRTLDVEGQITNLEGKPIAGAIIVPRGDFVFVRSLTEALAKRFATTSDSEGRFCLRSFPVGVTPVLTIAAAGYGKPSIVPNDELPLEIRLARSGGINGKISISDKAASSAGIQIELRRREEAQPAGGEHQVASRVLGHETSTVTDGDGNFAIAELPPGSYKVVAQLPEPLKPDVVVGPFIVESGNTVHVEVPVARTVKVRGRVVDEQTGKPIPEIGMECRYLDNQSPVSNVAPSKTDTQGFFELLVKPGRLEVQTDFRWDHTGPYETQSQHVEIADNDVELPDLRLKQTPKVTIAVKDSDGKPVNGADVDVVADVPRHYDDDVRTDAEGKAIVYGIAEGEAFHVHARSRQGITPGYVRIVKGPDSVAEVSVSNENGFRVRGRIVDGANQPIGDARVRINWSNSQNIDGQLRAGFRSESATIEADGRFVTLSVTPGVKLQMSVSAQGYESYEITIDNGIAGELRDLGEIVLSKRVK